MITPVPVLRHRQNIDLVALRIQIDQETPKQIRIQPAVRLIYRVPYDDEPGTVSDSRFYPGPEQFHIRAVLRREFLETKRVPGACDAIQIQGRFIASGGGSGGIPQ